MHTVVARGTCRSQNAQSTTAPEHIYNLRCEKVNAVVARRKFRSQNIQATPCSDHFWKLRCRKVHAGAAQSRFPSQKCTKHTTFRSLLEVAISKKCMLLWREADFEEEMYKTHHVQNTFGS